VASYYCTCEPERHLSCPATDRQKRRGHEP